MALTPYQNVCLALLGLGSVIVCAGVASPMWESRAGSDVTITETNVTNVTKTTSGYEVQIGLYYFCKIKDGSDILTGCSAHEWDLGKAIGGDGEFFKAARVLMGVSALFSLMTAVAAIVCACRREDITCIKLPATFSLWGGICGIAGVVLFAAWDFVFWDPLMGDKPTEELNNLVKGWSFYLSCVGSGYLLLISILGMTAPGTQGKYVLEFAGCGTTATKSSDKDEIHTVYNTLDTPKASENIYSNVD